jgi:phosphohistidine phosphatase
MDLGQSTTFEREVSLMIELYILRHGIAVDPGTPGIADDDRRLTPEGRKKMRQIAAGLRRLDLQLDRVLTSPLARARATAEIVASELGLRDRIEIATALHAAASAASIKTWLNGRSEDRLMIVGHNPSLSELVSLLVSGSGQTPICDLKKGGVAALVRGSATSNRFDIAWIATPGLIRRLGKG